jgi:hypothetical protein
VAGEPCSVWDVDPGALGVCPAWSGYTVPVKTAALRLASFWLWAATGRRFGPCPITVRPNQARRGEPVAYQVFPVTPGTQGMNQPGGPFLFGGRWFNDGCGAACCGDDACAIVLRGPVYAINEITVDDEVIPDSAYRVDITNGVHLLVRIDGECWPTCQSVSAEPGEIGSFVVDYEIGEAIPEVLALAAGALACEYGKYLTGGACALPAQMTRLSRQGVEIEVEPPAPGEGKSGIRLVDDVVKLLNPSGRQGPVRVMSPDVPGACDRYTTVPAGS